MSNNNLSNGKSKMQEILFLLPKSCMCTACNDTKNLIRKELGESKFLKLSREAGLVI